MEDPDGLAERCRDPNARQQIAEAVQCHQAGAQRAAIVSIWIAVVYDIFGKLRELAQSGDGAAASYVATVDNAVEQHDISLALKIESSILDEARDKFALLSANEHEDLSRLHLDRHRCAHPSMNRPEEIYVPAPELVRVHLRNAVVHLLSQPPVQGRAALDQLQREVDSELFPKTVSDAAEYISGGIYRRMKPALLRGFCKAALASCMTEAALTSTQFTRRVRAILALRTLHEDTVNAALEERLSSCARGVPEGRFHRLLMLAGSIQGAYLHLETDIRLQAQTYIANAPPAELARSMPYALAIPELADAARLRVAGLTAAHLEELFVIPSDREPPLLRATAPELLDRIVELYAESRSWDSSNRMATKLVIPSIQAMTPEQVGRILSAFATNGEVYMSSNRTSVLTMIQASGKAHSSLMDAALAKCEMTREDISAPRSIAG